jgi:predicted secreted Zn-dependent protease
MKLVITIDVPDKSRQLVPAIEDRVTDCVNRHSEIVHGDCRVTRVRLLPDRSDAEREDDN